MPGSLLSELEEAQLNYCGSAFDEPIDWQRKRVHEHAYLREEDNTCVT